MCVVWQSLDSRTKYKSQEGRRQNLNPEPKINLNHANLKPRICGLWWVKDLLISLRNFTQIKVSHCNVDRARRPILWRWQLGLIGQAWRMVAILVASVICSREWCVHVVGSVLAWCPK
jgi:hypothetical protein